MKVAIKTAAALVAAGALSGAAWMGVRFVVAILALFTPATVISYSLEVQAEADKLLGTSLPLFLLDNGSVAFSDSSGYIAVGGGLHENLASQWAAASEAVTSLTVIAVLIAVLMLSISLLRGVRFTPTLSRWVGGAGLALLVGGALAQLFTWLSRQEMIAAVAPTVASNRWRLPSSATPFDLVPLATGAVLLVFAMAFAAGTRLQKDTEGLV